MATSDTYEFRIKCSVDDEIAGLKSLFANAQDTADKNTIKVRVTGDEKELAKELEKLTKLNPSVLTKIVLDVDSGNLKETSEFLSKVIGNQLKQSGEISKAFKDQITSGIDEKQIKGLLSSTLKNAFGDSTKITSGNISSLFANIKKEVNELNAVTLKGMDTEQAFEKITELAKQLEILQSAFKNQDAAGLTNALKPTNLDFSTKELKSTMAGFYTEIGNYIASDTQQLNNDITAAYTKVKDNLLQNLIQIFSGNGENLLEAFSIDGAEAQIVKNKEAIERIKNTMLSEVQKAKDSIYKILDNGYSGGTGAANSLFKYLQIIETYTGEKFTDFTAKQQETLDAMLQNVTGKETIIKAVAAALEALNNQITTYTTNSKYLENYVIKQQGEIGTQVVSQMSAINSGKVSGNAVGVEVEPVISDPAAFITKIEEQLVNQVIKVAIEPTIKSVAEFEQLLQQQLPNQFITLKLDKASTEVPVTPTVSNPTEFAQKVRDIIAGYPAGIDVTPIINDITAFQEAIKSQIGAIPITISPTVDPIAKENLKEATTFDFSGVSTAFDNLKDKVVNFKKEITTLHNSAKNALTTVSSLFEQFSVQPTTDSSKITSVIESLNVLSETVNKNVDVEKTGNFVQALNEIGKLQVNPNVDLSKFKLGKLDTYLTQANQLTDLGIALNSLAEGLDSLNIALTGANFDALKGVKISDKTIENIPKFANGLAQLKEELEKFSSSATGVLTSISQITKQAKSLEYLYKLSTAPSSSAQSNIIGNGLMSAFDKSAINSIQHPTENTDEVAALAKEYQWLTSQAKIYFNLSSKFAKGTISSSDAATLIQLQRAMEGAIQRMTQFQETDQSLITAQNDLNTALSQNVTAIEGALVNNLDKAIGSIDEAQAKSLGFENALDGIKNKAVDIQNAFASNGLISSTEIESAETILKKALEDVKQLKVNISTAQKAQDKEIQNSYKNILGDYSQSALGKNGTNVVTDSVEIQKLANEYNYLNEMVGKYIHLLAEDAGSTRVNDDRISKIQALTKAYEDFAARQTLGIDTDERLQSSTTSLNASLEEMSVKLQKELVENLNLYISKITKAENGTAKYTDSVDKIQQAQATINNLLESGTTNFDTIKKALEAYSNGLSAYKTVMSEVTAAERSATEAEKETLLLDIQKWMNKNTKAAAKYKEELEALQAQISKVNNRGELETVKAGFLKIQNQAEALKETGVTVADVLKTKFKELGTYLMTFVSFYKIISVIKEGISTVQDYDDALTEMRKVTDTTVSSLKEFQKESFEIADQVGTTAEQLQQSTADWLRLGESFEQAKESAKDSTILLNVSEFDDIDSATESLVAMSQAYQDLDKMEIIDKLNNVGNNFSIATDELAESLQRSVATLKVTGNDINEAIALTVAGR